MDSMRSLDSSLPPSRPSRTPPPDLLQAFRTAALSVTNLYKSAAADQSSSRQAGYQDALEDLLKFLDHENLGLQDGEGWRIRQWATQRYDGGHYQQCGEEDEEIEHVTRQTRSSSTLPVQHDTEILHDKHQQDTYQADLLACSASSKSSAIFQFSGSHGAESHMQSDASSSTHELSDTTSSSHNSSPIQFEVVNRSISVPRTQSTRQSYRSNPREFTFTAGTKRKLNFPDFFDISNIPDRKDEHGGTKKGRLH